MLHFIYEALKTAGVMVLVGCAAVTLILIFGLAGCSSIEGAGFENRGAHSDPACMSRDARGHEVWRSC